MRRHIAFYVSITLYLASFFLPATQRGIGESYPLVGFGTFLLAVFYVPLGWFAFAANFVYLFAWGPLFAQDQRSARMLTTTAVLLALTAIPILLKHGLGFNIGFYVWIGSMVLPLALAWIEPNVLRQDFSDRSKGSIGP